MAEEAKARGDAAFGKRDFEDAIRHYTAAIELDPDNHVLHSNRSAAYGSLGQWPEALIDARRTLQLKPQWSRSHLRVGNASIGLGRFDVALQLFKKGLELDPDDEGLKSGYARARAEVKKKIEPLKPHPFGDLFRGPEMWEKLKSDATISGFAQQNDFVEMMRDVQRDWFNINDHSNDSRLLHAIGVLLNVKFRAGSPHYPPAREEDDPPSGEQVTDKENEEPKEASASEEKDASASEEKDDKGAAATEEKGTSEQEEAAASEERDAPATEEKAEKVAEEEKEVDIEEDEGKVLETSTEQHFMAMDLEDEHDSAISRLRMKEKEYAGDFDDASFDEIGSGDASASRSEAEESTGKETALTQKTAAAVEKEEKVAAATEEKGTAEGKEVETEEGEGKVPETSMEQNSMAMVLDDEDDEAMLRLGMKEYAWDFEDSIFDDIGSEVASASEAGESPGKETSLTQKTIAYRAAVESFRNSLSENRFHDLFALHDASRLAKELEGMLSKDPEILDSDTEGEGDSRLHVYILLHHYTEKLKNDSSNIEAYSNRAACYMKLGQFSHALKDAEQCIDLKKNSPLGYWRKGNALFSMEELHEAAAAYLQGLQENPTDPRLSDGLAKCRKRIKVDQSVEESKASQDEEVPEPASHPDKEDEAVAQPSLGQEKGDECAPAIVEQGGFSDSSEVHKEDETVPEPTSDSDKENEAVAQPSLDQEKGKNSTPAAAEQGGSLGSSDELDGKDSDGELAKRESSFEKEMRMEELQGEKILDAALEEMLEEIQIEDVDKVYNMNIFNTIKTPFEGDESGKLAIAKRQRDHCTNRLESNPEKPTLYSNRSMCHMRLGNFHDALKDADRCIELDPCLWIGYHRKGQVLFRMKKPDAAAEAYILGLDKTGNNEELSKAFQKFLSEV